MSSDKFPLELANLSITPDEVDFLRNECPYLDEAYLHYLKSFRLRPNEQVELSFQDLDSSADGDLHITVRGLWVETILYEIPLLALTSEAYFKFCNTDWDYDGQEERAYWKAKTLLEAGCVFSDFGSRRRRDYHTHDLVIQGLVRASKKCDGPGKLTGTSNVHLAMKHGIPPVGTVAHEWYMGIAAITNNYEEANELGLRYWVACFGEGVGNRILLLIRCRTDPWDLGPGNRADRYFWDSRFFQSFQATNPPNYNGISWSSSDISFRGKRLNGCRYREPS